MPLRISAHPLLQPSCCLDLTPLSFWSHIRIPSQMELVKPSSLPGFPGALARPALPASSSGLASRRPPAVPAGAQRGLQSSNAGLPALPERDPLLGFLNLTRLSLGFRSLKMASVSPAQSSPCPSTSRLNTIPETSGLCVVCSVFTRHPS